MTRPVQVLEAEASGPRLAEDVVDALYRRALDVLVLRAAFEPAMLAGVRGALEGGGIESNWHHPNAGIPGIGIRVLGTTATPTGTAPRGPDVAQYFASAAERRASLTALFGTASDPVGRIEGALAQAAGGRPVVLASLADGRSFGPCTIRSLPDGQGIFLHNDYHYSIAVYDELAPQLDTSTCISYFFLVQAPQSGGRICVFGLERAEEGELPRLPNGLLNAAEVERRVPHRWFDLHEGDLFVFRSGDLYHRVEPVVGPRTRVTMGGFLALDAGHSKVVYWS